ncbi:MAG: hypothetical protein AAFW75_27130 [Cyanobacteria bacterium J06636_16]
MVGKAAGIAAKTVGTVTTMTDAKEICDILVKAGLLDEQEGFYQQCFMGQGWRQPDYLMDDWRVFGEAWRKLQEHGADHFFTISTHRHEVGLACWKISNIKQKEFYSEGTDARAAITAVAKALEACDD